MITFDAVTVRYPRATRDALDGVTLGAPAGAITAVVGPNGSGKSTLVRTLLRRLPVAGGTVQVDGRSLDTFDDRELARCTAVLAQREELAFPMVAREYVALGRFPHGGAWSAMTGADRAAMESAIARAEIDSLLDRRVDTLSGGEWQRVRLARALAQGGSTLVLDEPTAFLDIAHEMSVFELLIRLAGEGQAVLLVSHQLNLVARFAHAIVLLKAGRVVAAGTPTDVMRADILQEVYEWPLAVTYDAAAGAPSLVPLRQR
jgi:iron complex transport system ATP-binding protein